MNINRHNYEIYFIDYSDGKLNPIEIDLLFSFLNEHPDLKDELESFNNLSLESETVEYPDKLIIKKFELSQKIDASNFEEFCIARLEGNLASEKQDELNVFLENNPTCQLDAKLYTKTKLIPDLQISYPLKQKLKRTTILRKRIYQFSYAIAASLLLFVLLNNIWKNQDHRDPVITEIANISKNPNNPEATIDSTKKHIIESQKTIPENIIQQQINTPEITSHDNMLGSITPKNNNAIIEKIEEKYPLKKLNTIKITEVKSNTIPSGDNMLYLAFIEPIIVEKKKEKSIKLHIKKPTVYNLADIGIKGINKLLGSNMSLEKKYDDEGNYTALAFNSRLISFSKNIDE